MKYILAITILTTITHAQGITNTIGGNTAGDKFIVENSDSEASLIVTGEGNVGIGTINPLSKLSVGGDGNSYAIIYSTTSDINGYSILGEATGFASGVGVHGHATATSGIHYGGYFEVENQSGRGVYATSSTSTGSAYGGVFEAFNSPDGVGAYANGEKYDFYAAGAGENYGVASSIRWKNNIVEIKNPLEKLAGLRGIYFDWDQEHGGGHDVGCIAEEVGKVLPEIVVYEKNGIDANGMDYSKLTPLLIEAVKALQKRVEALENR